MRASTRDALAEGLYAGLIGYAVVILVTSVIDLLAGRSVFYTPALFGATLFYGLRDPSTLIIAPGPVLAYNMVHLLVFVVMGEVAAWCAVMAERHPSAQYLLLVLLLFVAFHLYAAMLLFAQPLLGGAGWWKLGVGAIAAAIAMGAFLLWDHPLLRRELREIPMGDAS